MADRDEYWYLDDSVDVSRITVPELRSILLKHGVTYPSSAKKPVLVALFNDRVLPQAAKIHRATARTKPSARGIVDVPSSQESTTTDDVEDETLLAPPPSARRTSRRTARASTEELRAEPAPGRRGNSAARHVPTKHARGSDAEVEEQPPVRRTRKSVTPAVKEDSPDPEAWHRHDAESPFTQENPFQGGSSPPAPDSKARDRRRKTMGFEQREKRKSDAYRRKSAMPNVEQLDEGIVVPTRRTFDMPASRVKKEESEFETDGVEAGEEFTPEEQMELVRENAVAGKADILPPRRKKRPSKATGVAKGLTLAVATTLLAAFGGAWSQEKFAVGYCGIGRESTSLGGIEVPDWADFLLPQCEQCPAHATCYPHLDLDCDDDFIKKPHPLSLGGALPLSATCEPDSEKTRRITLVADKSVQILRERRARYECGEPGPDGQVFESPEVKETELKEELSSMRRKGMSQEEFEDLWRSALGEITTREEIVEGSDGFIAAATESQADSTEPLLQTRSQSSVSSAASSAPSDKRLDDIFGSLF
ncbi:Man1-Src1p-C-terminal domain-domain-containing protein [Clohesyomyces aquaticus]|uniref:Man1-Src1p-C-terminal domain-domain-containing protein n=1 Tax=Clohesyomyces aquaticus TaxID=1231657 RepID=A0A1Y1ZJJ6_9PLEO|nr:Man1-Src1p-C-terminal domain-domain-containing protein [Clohesyomyces aquaticus]